MTVAEFQFQRARLLVDRVAGHLSLIAQRATLSASSPEPESGAEDIVGGLADIKTELRELRTIARRWHRANDAA